MDISFWPNLFMLLRVANEAKCDNGALDVNYFHQIFTGGQLIWHRHVTVGLGLVND